MPAGSAVACRPSAGFSWPAVGWRSLSCTSRPGSAEPDWTGSRAPGSTTRSRSSRSSRSPRVPSRCPRNGPPGSRSPSGSPAGPPETSAGARSTAVILRFHRAPTCFYLGFYPPTYLGLVLLVRRRLSRFNASIWLDGVMASLAAASIGAAVLLEVILDQTHGRLLAVRSTSPTRSATSCSSRSWSGSSPSRAGGPAAAGPRSERPSS